MRLSPNVIPVGSHFENRTKNWGRSENRPILVLMRICTVKGERDGIGERETKKTTEVLAHRERERKGGRERGRERGRKRAAEEKGRKGGNSKLRFWGKGLSAEEEEEEEE